MLLNGSAFTRDLSLCVCLLCSVWEQVLGAGVGFHSSPVSAPMGSGAASLAHQLCMEQAWNKLLSHLPSSVTMLEEESPCVGAAAGPAGAVPAVPAVHFPCL